VPENRFGEKIAARYDESTGDEFEPSVIEQTVDFLACLAGEGSALELAVGTGRIALPLSRRGVRVSGIDLSQEMVARLREKPGSEAIDVTIGDIATARVDCSFSLVYLVFNTIGNLTTQDEQVACFENAAVHLARGGCFVVELGVPELRRLPHGETSVIFDKGDDHVGIDEYGIADQRLVSHHYSRREDGRFEYVSLPFRYAWPAELDLMARIAGLRLRERWADWDRSPFTSESPKHVSVWEKP
jgi:SAM-dependent methyltransferase